jgi:hypothetical protein
MKRKTIELPPRHLSNAGQLQRVKRRMYAAMACLTFVPQRNDPKEKPGRLRAFHARHEQRP